jgi:hypothetical protein
MRRRTLLGALSTATAATAGCLGVLTGSEPLEREAATARVGDDALASTDYELADSSSQRIEREVTVAGQTREVHAVNQLGEYHRTVDLGPLGEQKFAVFAVLATPAFEIGGQVMSPVEEWSDRKLARQIQGQYENLEVGEKVDSRSVETLDTEMDVSKFEGTASISGNTGVDIYLHVGKVRHDEDFVLAIGVYPQRLSGEGEAVGTLVGGLTH